MVRGKVDFLQHEGKMCLFCSELGRRNLYQAGPPPHPSAGVTIKIENNKVKCLNCFSVLVKRDDDEFGISYLSLYSIGIRRDLDSRLRMSEVASRAFSLRRYVTEL